MTDLPNPLDDAAQEIMGKLAFDVETRIKDSIHAMRVGWVTLARDLYEFYIGQMWTALGHDTMEEWMASPDIDLSRRWVYDLIAMYREYVINRQVDAAQLGEIEPTKLQMLLPAVRRQQIPLKAALADAKVLSRNDLRERYTPNGAGTTRTSAGPAAPDNTTSYDAEAEPTYVRCPTCNSRVRQEEIG